MVDELQNALRNLLKAIGYVVIFVLLLSGIAGTLLEPKPGDPFFEFWQNLISSGPEIFLLVIPGAGILLHIYNKYWDAGFD